MKILGIETSCDETGLAILEADGGLKAPRFRVEKSLVASQIKIHQPYGGVVPGLAKREHLKNLPVLYKKMFGPEGSEAEKKLWSEIDLITVTVGPGLEPALWTGIEFAKALAKKWKKPLVGANHLEGHLYSFLLPSRSSTAYSSALLKKPAFPAVALIVSGGHTILLHMDSFSKWTRLGETRDDATGEAYDKVARLLDLPYPGGPEIEKLSAKGNSFAVTFPRPMLHEKNYDFSFSGLKTAVLYYLRDFTRDKKRQPNARERADIAAGFEQAAIDVLVAKAKRAAQEYGAESILLSGGVAANKHLRKALTRAASLVNAQCFVPDFKYNLDNAAMVAAAGWFAYLRKKKYPLKANGALDI